MRVRLHTDGGVQHIAGPADLVGKRGTLVLHLAADDDVNRTASWAGAVGLFALRGGTVRAMVSGSDTERR